MKRGFTLIELIFSIVILGIIGMIGAEIVSRVFERYAATRDMERAQSDLRRTLDILAARLSYRIKNSAVAYDINGGLGVAPIYPTTGAGIPDLDNYEALEWVGIAYESQRGRGTAPILPGWSSIGVRVTDSPAAGGADRFYSPLSNFEIAKQIEAELTGLVVGGNPFALPNPLTVLVFAGRDWRGETPTGYAAGVDATAKHLSWNWIPTSDVHSPRSYFQLTPDALNDGNFTIASFVADPDDLRQFHPPSYSGANNMPNYYLARSAYAVWVNNGALTLAYNFRPWNGETFNAAPSQILLTDVTKFLFQESGDVLRLRLCVKASDWAAMGNNDDNATQFCRERTVL
ncbi:MAG: type II secretion system GspH family protein [Helicobacteraceae bacterium]|jgi:prepilin-type N-terminal cleavage/methylation domain-containing protein|nr:type II secretion system GspH family protein [Helicobacteraceae bacterium]